MKISVIINTRASGRTARDFESLLSRGFGSSLVAIEHTMRPGSATLMARRAAKEGVDTIVAVGGDGTANEVINGIVGSETALALIPLGTANDLGTRHGLAAQVPQACEIIRRRRLRSIDLIEVNGRCYATGGGLGLASDIAARANDFKSRGWGRNQSLVGVIGCSVYFLAALRVVLEKPFSNRTLRLKIGDWAFSTEALSLLILNQSQIGGRFMVAPEAINDDGLFDVCLIEGKRSRHTVLALILRFLTRRPIEARFIRRWRTSTLEIQSSRPVVYSGDGERLVVGTNFSVKLLPRALKLVVPRDACN